MLSYIFEFVHCRLVAERRHNSTVDFESKDDYEFYHHCHTLKIFVYIVCHILDW